MYSGTRSDNPLLTPQEVEQATQFEEPMAFTSEDGSSLSLYHDYRMTFSEVWETLFPEVQADLETILEDEEEISDDDMLESTIDLYVEEVTGISVMVPTQCTLEAMSDGSQTYISTTSPGGLVTMSVYISVNNSMEEGMEVMEAFKNVMAENGQVMEPEEDEITDYRDDTDTPYYSEYVENTLTDEDGEVTGEFFADLIINDGDFLAITVTINDWSALEEDAEERMFLYLLQTCALLSDFAIY